MERNVKKPEASKEQPVLGWKPSAGPSLFGTGKTNKKQGKKEYER